MIKIIPVILAGGAGTRLWPLSREDKPKQFHNISGKGTLLVETIMRLLPINPNQYVIVTSKKHEKETRKQLNQTGIIAQILAEPYPRNTAAAVIYAATYISKLEEDCIMIMLPADHYIKNNNLFVEVLLKAIDQAKQGKLVSIGIKPTFPETGYGYIKAEKSDKEILDVEKFFEKPDYDNAKKYVDDGNYYWNSGIFIWKISTIINCFRKLLPKHYNAFEKLRKLTINDITNDSEKVWKIKSVIFEQLESISIDYGIMENADNRIVIPGQFGWADLGTWNAIDDILHPDEHDNRTPDEKDVIFINSTKCTAFPENKRITIVGLSNVVVVESGNDILVMEKNSAQEVRKVVELIKNKK
jgi:mannose-1-phosphate guanylyltransferase